MSLATGILAAMTSNKLPETARLANIVTTAELLVSRIHYRPYPDQRR
jgi:hypothetical protein